MNAPGADARLWLMLLLSAVSIVWQVPGAVAQTPTLAPPPQPAEAEPGRAITAATIEAQRKQLETIVGLDEAQKKKIDELYTQAIESLQRADAAAARAQTFKQETEHVPARLQQLQQRLNELRNTVVTVPAEMALPELEQELAKADRQLADLKQAQLSIESEPAARASRRRDVRNLLLAIPPQLEEIDRQLQATPPQEEPAPLTLARRSELLARRVALEQDLPVLQNELTKLDAEDANDLVRLQRDVSIQEVAAADRLFQALDGRVKQLRDEAARAAVRTAEEEALRAVPLLKTIAERNQTLASDTQRVTQLTNDTDSLLQKTKARLEEVQRQFAQDRELVEEVGLTRSVGAQLRKRKGTLPNVSRRRQDIRTRQQTIEDIRFELFTLDDERQLLARPEVLIDELLETLPAAAANAERERLRSAAASLLERKREYSDNLIRIQNAYFDALTTLDAVERQVVNLTDEYVAYINERVLWIRSGPSLAADMTLSDTNLWIISPVQWQAVGQKLAEDVRELSTLWLAAVLAYFALFFQRRRLRGKVRELGEQAARRNCTQFRLTFQAALLTVVLAAIWPLACGFLAWRLSRTHNTVAFVNAVAAAIWAQACAYFVIEMLRQTCRRQGLAESHFDWSVAIGQTLRSNLLLLIVFGLPFVFLTSILYVSDPEQGTGVLERFAFAGACVVASVFLARVMKPSGGLLYEYLAHHRDGWLDRLKYVWYWAVVVAPLGLAALAFRGFFYTAQQLTVRSFWTVSLILLLVWVRAILLRLLLVHRRHLSIRQARERRAAALAALQSEAGTHARSQSMAIVPVEEAVDLGELSSQTQRIVTTMVVAIALVGGWAIWDDAVPALRVLDNWQVWSGIQEVAENVADPGEEPVIEKRYVLRVVTVADVLLASLVGVIMLIAFRNLPGLLEIAVLQRLPLDASVRYAITALASYAIIMIGVLVAAGTLGLRWSQIQWLATALTFGLAFGLQEMFANFVAGLIILFERPIRVGDVVTVDDITGVVSRVRIRATTITNWDRKEFVVPNKEFITGRLLNWTLSDQVNRVVITVGVAYGTKTEMVRELLLKIAKEHPLILSDPEPYVAFDAFADSSLNFTLRVFLPTMDNRLVVINDLHTAIHEQFNQAGIVIPFPQRDVHFHAPTVAPAPQVAGGEG